MRTRRQLDVVAAVPVHKQAGQENRKNVYTRTHVCKQTAQSLTNAHPSPTNKDTNNVSVYVLSCTDPGNGGGMSAVRARPCLC